ncbi:MAG: hypothetical protein MRZ62_02765, partial [Brachyspira sp.]|nr:hypothetical protein [Brachyspira sp.]
MLRLWVSLIVLVMGVSQVAFAETPTVLKAGVSLVREVPPALMGTWRVAAALKSTDSPTNFKKTSVDIWNLSRNNDVINLSNPFTGATASINVSYVNK